MAAETVDLGMVAAGLAISRRARQSDVLRRDLTALGLPWPVVELIIANRIVNW